MLRARLGITIWAISVLILLKIPGAEANPAAGNNREGPRNFFTLGDVTWWAHDYKGYHPSILVKLENVSGMDLTGEKIRFQARFMDLRTGILTVARKQIRQALKPHQQFTVFLKAPYAFDLPRDSNQWPPIECKLMCRVGDVGDEGTETLVITRLDNITMTMDSALEQISKTLDYNRSVRTRQRRAYRQPPPVARQQTKPPEPVRPLKAAAGALGTVGRSSTKSTLVSFFSSGKKPGIGDDFYVFEKEYGLPRSTETEGANWTWANFSRAQLDMQIFAASPGKTGKVDMLVLEIPSYQISSDSDLITLVKSLASKSVKQKLGEVKKSVTYLPSGRREVSRLKATGFSAAWVAPRGSDPGRNTYILIVSKTSGEPDNLLGSHVVKVKMLSAFKPIFGSN